MTQRERQEHSRKQILQAALEEFGTYGYTQVTVDNICARHDISKGMLYHYYAGKDDLFLLCVGDTFEKLSEFVANDKLLLQDRSALESLIAYYQCREQFFEAHPLRRKIFECAMLHPPVHLESKLRELRAPVWKRNRQFWQRAIQQYPLRTGLTEEQVTRYLVSLDYAFPTILEQYNQTGTVRDIHDMLQVASELLNMILFGVMQPNKEEEQK